VRVIARTWHGRVPASKADAYQSFLERTGLADYAKTPGYRGVLVLRAREGDVTRFTLTSFWDSVDAIRRFAGDDYARARYYDEDEAYLLEKEPVVTHADVVALAVPAGV
jgi:heme-degrading monooxygenase HmoA